jgi:uncharacterized protein
MLLLLNTTKTMDLNAVVPGRLKTTEPRQMDQARLLAAKVAKLNRPHLVKLMALSEKLADETRANAALWGRPDRAMIPSLYGFTGLVYKSLAAADFDAGERRQAQNKVRILSGLYGVLRPFDLIEAYRLEMGHKLAVGQAKNLVEFWKDSLTDVLNEDLKHGEAVVTVAAQEYMKAVDLKRLKGPVIFPVFKEQHADGSLKTVAVHSKKARGELIRYAVVNKAKAPKDLLGFNALGWEATREPPKSGPWLFTRPVTNS